MATSYKGKAKTKSKTQGKTETKTKAKPPKKGGKGGGTGGGGGEGFVPNDPIIVTGGSAKLKFNKNQFKDKGPQHENDTAILKSVVIDGGTPILVNKDSVIVINFS